MKRKTAIFAVLVMLLGLLAACGGGGGSSDSGTGGGSSDSGSGGSSSSGGSDNGGGQEEVEFRVAWWGSVDRHEIYNTIIDEYESQNPHVTIVREYAGFTDYWNRIATQAAGGNAPDLLTLHTQIYGREYPDKGVLLPLDEYIESGQIDVSDWDQSIVDAGRVDGTLYSISKGVTLGGMNVNTDMIKRAGAEVPAKDKTMTYQEFFDWAVEVQKGLPEGTYVVNDNGWHDSFFDLYVRNKGKALFSPDGNGVGFDEEDLIEWWTYWSDMRAAGLTPTPEISAEYKGLPNESSSFVVGINAIEWQNTNQGKIFQLHMDDHVDILRTPVVEGGEYISGENPISSGWAITKDSDPAVRDEIVKFINWFVNDEWAQLTFNAELGVVGNQTVAELLEDTIAQTDVYAFEHLAEISGDFPPAEPWAEGGSTFRQLFETTYDQINFGQMTVEEAAKHLISEANRQLGE